MPSDYSSHVEVIAHEESAILHEFWASEGDLRKAKRRVPDELSQPGMIDASGSQAATSPRRLDRERVRLFDSFECLPGNADRCWFALMDWMSPRCCLCGTPMAPVRDVRREDPFRHVKVNQCSGCGWWESDDHFQLKEGPGNHYSSYSALRRAVLRDYSVADVEVPIDTLRSHLARRPEDFYDVHPTVLETLVGSIFGEVMDCEAIHLGGPADGGIDLVLVRGNQEYVVQVKRRSRGSKTESVSLIREFLGAMLLRGSAHGIFVTTADRYSKPAHEAARLARARGLVKRLDLIDGRRLADVCKLTAPEVARDAWPRLEDPLPW